MFIRKCSFLYSSIDWITFIRHPAVSWNCRDIWTFFLSWQWVIDPRNEFQLLPVILQNFQYQNFWICWAELFATIQNFNEIFIYNWWSPQYMLIFYYPFFRITTNWGWISVNLFLTPKHIIFIEVSVYSIGLCTFIQF